MSDADQVRADFTRQTTNHSMEVLRDDGKYRHLKFTNNGSQNFRFDLITWPGYLTYCGDMGTYTFSRLPDMFEFFRDEHEGINPGYWGEKLQGYDKHTGYRKFSPEVFRKRVSDRFHSWIENTDATPEAADDLFDAIEYQIMGEADDSEFRAYCAIENFFHYGSDFRFDDFFDDGVAEEYTFHYIWCCLAIVWGIQQYDQLKENAA